MELNTSNSVLTYIFNPKNITTIYFTIYSSELLLWGKYGLHQNYLACGKESKFLRPVLLCHSESIVGQTHTNQKQSFLC